MKEQSKPLTLKEAVDNFMLNGDIPTPVIRKCREVLNVPISHFGAECLLASITETQVQEFYSSRIANYNLTGSIRSNPNKEHIRRMFRLLMEFALNHEWISEYPIPDGEAMRGVKPLNIAWEHNPMNPARK